MTKSGGNTFRGEGHYYYIGSGLSAGPVKRLVLSPVDDRTVSYIQDDEQTDNRHEIGGSLGGIYDGISAEATVGAGVGANVLVGGTAGSVHLQTVSVQGQLGLNVAAAGTSVTLIPVN